MNQRPTFSEVYWPMDAESLELAREWAQCVTEQVLDWTWRAFESLHDQHLARMDFQQPLEQIERDLTAKHFSYINVLWAKETGGFSALVPHHEFPELASRPLGAGKPPAYDFAFVWQENPRIAWPMEAKVVKTPGTLREYLADVDKFCSGKAAPFVDQGGLIAYLLSGSADDFFGRLESKLNVPLTKNRIRERRAYRYSFHERQVAPRICLHHLVLSPSKRRSRRRAGQTGGAK